MHGEVPSQCNHADLGYICNGETHKGQGMETSGKIRHLLLFLVFPHEVAFERPIKQSSETEAGLQQLDNPFFFQV